MKQSTNYRRFAFFFMLLGLFMSPSAHAEFNSYSIDDTLVGPGSILYDIDGNGTNDYRFEIIEVAQSQYIARVTSIGSSAFLDEGITGFPDALDFGEEITGDFAQGSGILGYVDDQGEFKAAGDKYLGLRIDANGYKHYGWIMINLNTFNDKMIIKSVGYNESFNETSYAGQTGENSGLEEIDQTQFSVYPNPCVDYLKVRVPSGLTNMEVVLYNQNGQEMLHIGNDTEFDVSDFPMGVYFVQIKSDEMNETRKVVIN